jgi:hypothetical protein
MPSLDAANRAREILRRAGVKIRPADPITKARRNPRSLRLAIDAKCFDCVGGGADPNPRGAIRDCRITSCTLHPVRPYQRRVE